MDLPATQLLPTPSDFDIDARLRGRVLATEIFWQVAEYAKMTPPDWDFQLEETDVLDLDKVLVNVPHNGIPATANPDGEQIPPGAPLPIRFSSELSDSPDILIAEFSRDLAHYLMWTAENVDALDDIEWSTCLCDVGATLLGFGVFTANSIFQFEQVQKGSLAGWQSRRSGSLGEIESAYALAISLRLADLPSKPVLKHLRDNPRGYLKAALKDLRKNRSGPMHELKSTCGHGPYRR